MIRISIDPIRICFLGFIIVICDLNNIEDVWLRRFYFSTFLSESAVVLHDEEASGKDSNSYTGFDLGISLSVNSIELHNWNMACVSNLRVFDFVSPYLMRKGVILDNYIEARESHSSKFHKILRNLLCGIPGP